jgi:hypothetical protein
MKETFTTEHLREIISETLSVCHEATQFVGFTVQFAELISVASQFMEWCADYKGGVLLTEFLIDTGKYDEQEARRLLDAIVNGINDDRERTPLSMAEARRREFLRNEKGDK